MKKIYFVRHGESEGNANRTHQSASTPLSQIGRSQAEILAHRFKSIQLDVLLSSPYQRAHETAQAIADVKNVQVETNSLLSEKRGPACLIGLSHHSQQSQEFKSAAKAHFLDDEGKWRQFDEETADEFAQRASDVLSWLSQREEESIVVVAHSLLLHMIMTTIIHPNGDLASKYQIYENFVIHNTSISVAEYNSDSQKWRLVCLNDHAHLG